MATMSCIRFFIAELVSAKGPCPARTATSKLCNEKPVQALAS
jgi:hypothetical protein